MLLQKISVYLNKNQSHSPEQSGNIFTTQASHTGLTLVKQKTTVNDIVFFPPKVVQGAWRGSTLRGSTATSCLSLRGMWSSWRPTLERSGPGDRSAPSPASSRSTLWRLLKICPHLRANSRRSPAGSLCLVRLIPLPVYKLSSLSVAQQELALLVILNHLFTKSI